MKQLLLTILLLLPVSFILAQSCQVDSTYVDSSAGVYPLPYDADLNPMGGITECAVIGEFFQFDFTIVIGDTLTVGGFSFPLDSIIVSQVQGLPQGISYSCKPSNCHYLKNTIGCAAIYGTPTAANAVGAYDLKIVGSAFINGSSLPLPLEFPNAALAPGKYTIHLLASNTDPCAVSSTNNLEKQVSIRTMPNPTAGFTLIDIASETAGTFNFRVTDLLGKVVEERKVQIFNGKNQIEFDGSRLSNGMYVLLLQNELGYVTQKLTIQH
jgi:hypothetical protein